jgi:hypothetical protein
LQVVAASASVAAAGSVSVAEDIPAKAVAASVGTVSALSVAVKGVVVEGNGSFVGGSVSSSYDDDGRWSGAQFHKYLFRAAQRRCALLVPLGGGCGPVSPPLHST